MGSSTSCYAEFMRGQDNADNAAIFFTCDLYAT